MVVLGGEEVSALVLDVGSHTTKAGYSGDDCPRAVFASAVGSIGERRILGDLDLQYPHKDLDIGTPVNGAEVGDWDGLERIWDFGVREKLAASWSEHPLLLVDNPAWTKETREKMVEMAFEKFSVPAVFLGRSPVMAAFAMGKYSALVVECSASGTSVVPVYDGYIVKSGILSQPGFGGNWLTEQTRIALVDDLKVGPLSLPQEVARREPVELGEPAQFTQKQLALSQSFRKFHEDRLIEDFKETICQVSEIPFNESDLAMRPPKYYEFPNGYNRNFGMERFRIGEIIFQPQKYQFAASTQSPPLLMGLTEMILKSIQQCDVDLRSNLAGNVLVTGGACSMHGLCERLNADLNRTPIFGRARVQSGSTTIERKFGAWIGGSILSSLGTFQQLWLTRQEYKEHGASYIDRKCP